MFLSDNHRPPHKPLCTNASQAKEALILERQFLTARVQLRKKCPDPCLAVIYKGQARSFNILSKEKYMSLLDIGYWVGLLHFEHRQFGIICAQLRFSIYYITLASTGRFDLFTPVKDPSTPGFSS